MKVEVINVSQEYYKKNKDLFGINLPNTVQLIQFALFENIVQPIKINYYEKKKKKNSK